MHTKTLLCLLLASCATLSPEKIILPEKTAPAEQEEIPATELPSKATEDHSLLGHYNIFNSLNMKTHRYGVVKEGNYYWGTIEIKTDMRVRFYVDSKLQKNHIYQFPNPPAKTFLAFGTLPPNGNLRDVYFYTPKESGYLFSGSIRKGSGMTSLLPQHYEKRFAHVRFVKRDSAPR